MNCRKCGKKTTVYDSRPANYGIRRRRKCLSCLHRETSIETWEIEVQKTEAHKPQLVPSPHPAKKKTATQKIQKISSYQNLVMSAEEITKLTDEELEDLIMSGAVEFDEDEL